MPDSTRPGPAPEEYRPVEVSARRPDSRLIREADPAGALMLAFRVNESAGQAGLDRLAAFAREQGLVVVSMNATQRSIVLWGPAARISQAFSVPLGVYESPAGTYCGWEGRLHLPAGLAEAIEAMSDLIEREIENLEHWLRGIWGPGGPGAGGSGTGQGTGTGSGDRPVIVIDLYVPPSGPSGPVNSTAFSLVQIFDMGWLTDPGCQRQLDNFKASPGAFKTIRIMKPFTNGIATVTTSRPALPNETGASGTSMSGNVWPAGGAIDFTGTLNGLYELTQRNLIPFVVLGFFPDGVYTNTSYAGASPGPSGPNPNMSPISPTDWTTIQANWSTLVEAFFAALIADPRFGDSAIAQWWFEVWNEPDNGSFWNPDDGATALTYYQLLYQATSSVVTTNNYRIRLGGPTIMGPNVTGTAPIMMSGFIDFLHMNKPQCDFLSFHGKGSWTNCLNGAQVDANNMAVAGSGPSLQIAVDAAEQTALLAITANLPMPITVINDEADMRVLFDLPFRPRMTEQFPAWLAALMIAYDSLTSEYAPKGINFMAGSDNAELPLVGWTQTLTAEGGPKAEVVPNPPTFAPAAFGQQRSIMTAATTGGPSNSNSWVSAVCPIDLLKVPAYNFYELLRFLGDQHGTFLSGSSNYYPHNDLFHMITFSSTQIGSVFCVYPPNPPSGPSTTPWPLNYSIVGIPWPQINWYQFQIDGTLSNSFSAAGGLKGEPEAWSCTPSPFPVTFLPLDGLNPGIIRQAQELSVANQMVGWTPKTPGRFDAPALSIPAYTTTMFWITEFSDAVPAQLTWSGPPTLDITPNGTNVVLSWQSSVHPAFYSYEVARDVQSNIVSPVPLRAALWIDTFDTVVSRGGHTYWIRAVSASNVLGPWSTAMSA
jgi:Glycosyl hydrolases family 39